MPHEATRNLTTNEPGPQVLRRFRNMPPDELLLHFLRHVLRSPNDSERWRHDHPRTKELLQRPEVASCLTDARRHLCALFEMPENSYWFHIVERCREDSAAGHAAMDFVGNLAREIQQRFPRLLDEYRSAVVATAQSAGPWPRHFEGEHGGQHKEGYIGVDGTFVSMVEDHDRGDGGATALSPQARPHPLQCGSMGR